MTVSSMASHAAVGALGVPEGVDLHTHTHNTHQRRCEAQQLQCRTPMSGCRVVSATAQSTAGRTCRYFIGMPLPSTCAADADKDWSDMLFISALKSLFLPLPALCRSPSALPPPLSASCLPRE